MHSTHANGSIRHALLHSPREEIPMTAIAEEIKAVTKAETKQQPRIAVQEKQETAVAGIADLSDGHGFLRTDGYRRSRNDIPLSAAQVRRFGLRTGDQIEGTAAGNSRNGTTLTSVRTVNGLLASQAENRPRFDDLTPIYPRERLRLEDGDPSPAARIIDLLAPIGKGQRGLIVAPPKAGKTTVLRTIANAIAEGHPEVHLM